VDAKKEQVARELEHGREKDEIQKTKAMKEKRKAQVHNELEE
jgi:hypothetical protein